MAKRWAIATAVLFAVGAVSGTILSFSFGLLWPSWTDFAGGIIGLPFFLEGFAFFTEAIFLGLYIYGWDKLSPKAHWLCTIPIAVAALASAFFIISVNSWMNQPTGFDIVNGVATNVDPVAAMLTSRAFPYEFTHGALAAYIAIGFAVAGVYALAMLRGDRSDYNKKALMLGLGLAAVFAPLQVVTGDLSARHLAHRQPEKFAAMEGQFVTEKGAPLRIGGIPFPDDHETKFAIEIPKLASFLSFEDFNAEIKGYDSFPQDERPEHLPGPLPVPDHGRARLHVRRRGGAVLGARLVEEEDRPAATAARSAGADGRARLRRHRGRLVRDRVRPPAVGDLPHHEDVRRLDAARGHLGAAHRVRLRLHGADDRAGGRPATAAARSPKHAAR